MGLYDPVQLGTLELANRFVRSATAERLSDQEGRPLAELAEMYRTLAEGGVGLIISGHAYVHRGGRAHPQMAGIYDDSLIVLMADHGAWVPVRGTEAVEGESDAVSPITIAMAIPVFAIKPPAASGELRISNAPTSIIDVPATVARILDFDADFPGVPAFGHDRNATRARHHLTYAYGINPDAEGFLFPMQEYEINGSPFDPTAWRQVATHPPATRLSRESEPLQTLPSAGEP